MQSLKNVADNFFSMFERMKLWQFMFWVSGSLVRFRYFGKDQPMLSFTKKRNHRPIIVSSALSFVFERLLYAQMIGYADTILVPYLCGFRKGFNTQHALLR